MMYFLHRLSDQVGGFNVFFYVTFRAVAAAITAFVLSLLFGNTVEATGAVLAAFLGSLAVGSALLGPLADRVRNPLRLYGLLEALAGVGALLMVIGGRQIWTSRPARRRMAEAVEMKTCPDCAEDVRAAARV